MPLKRKSAEEVTEQLLNIFCDSGPPQILHSDNGRGFSNNLLFSTLAAKWPNLKIVHGTPRHPETQGAVERVNRDVKDALFGMMHDHDNDHCWVRYLRWVQWNHNTSYHTAIRMTPYEAVYNKKPSIGLTNIGIPREFWPDINTEDDIDIFQREIAQPSVAEVNDHSEVGDNVPDFDEQSSPLIASSPLSKFPPRVNEYENEYDEPLPSGIIVSDCVIPSLSKFHILPSCSSFDQGSQSSVDRLSYPIDAPSDLSPLISPEPTCSSSIASKECVVCCKETSGAHTCPYCSGFIHVICGRSEGEEGYGSGVICPACDISNRNEECNQMRAAIKRSQENQQERMLNASSKKFKDAEVGDSVLIPISQPDKISSLGPRNILGCITSIGDSTYSIGTSRGKLAVNYSRNQFEVCPTKLLSIESIPSITVTQTEAMQNASLGIVGNSACRCKYCKTQRCPCKKTNRSCNTKCHRGHSCFNNKTAYLFSIEGLVIVQLNFIAIDLYRNHNILSENLPINRKYLYIYSL